MNSVIDSSVILAYWNREVGWQQAEAAITDGVASSLIYAEVVTRLALKGSTTRQIVDAWSQLQVPIHPFDELQALAAGLLVPLTNKFGLSLADRACLALARKLHLPAVTADRIWSKIDLGIEIKLIR